MKRIQHIISKISLSIMGEGRGVGLLLMCVCGFMQTAQAAELPDVVISSTEATALTGGEMYVLKNAATGQWLINNGGTLGLSDVQPKSGSKDMYAAEVFLINSDGNIDFALTDINDPDNGVVINPDTEGDILLAPQLRTAAQPTTVHVKGNNGLYLTTNKGKIFGVKNTESAATQWYAYKVIRVDHTFDETADPGHTLCSRCNHTFLRYHAKKRVAPCLCESLMDEAGNSIYVGSQNTWDATTGEGVMEFNVPLVTIGKNAFYDCTGFTGSLVIPNSVKFIGEYAFRYCGFTGSLIISNSVKEIGVSAFCESGFNGNLTIGNSVKKIDLGAFESCKFTGSLVIPNSVTHIWGNAFRFCKGFTSLSIPNTIIEIGGGAFLGCSGITTGTIVIPSTVIQFYLDVFDDCPGISKIVMNSIPFIGNRATNGAYAIYYNIDLALSDDSYVYTGDNEKYFPTLAQNFASAPTFSRQMDREWETIVVPFNITYDAENGNYKLYRYCSTTAEDMHIDEYANGDTIAAGTPMLIKAVGSKNSSGRYEVTLTAADWNVSTELSSRSKNGLTFKGAYNTVKVAADAGYVLDAEQFVKTTAETPVAPFHAYLSGSLTPNAFGLALHTQHVYDGHGICVICDAEQSAMDDITIADGTAYARATQATIGTLTYKRNVSESQVGKWQPLYVPFQMQYSDWSADFDVATIQNFHEYTDESGAVVNTVLEVRYVTSGKLMANHPYLIRPKSAGEKILTVQNTILDKAENNSIVCQSTERKYTFTGIYQPMKNLATNGYVFMAGGGFGQATNDDVTLKAQRWYLAIENTGSLLESVPANAAAIRIRVVGDEDATGIESLDTDTSDRVGPMRVCDLQGRRRQGFGKGINIVRESDGCVNKIMVK